MPEQRHRRERAEAADAAREMAGRIHVHLASHEILPDETALGRDTVELLEATAALLERLAHRTRVVAIANGGFEIDCDSCGLLATRAWRGDAYLYAAEHARHPDTT